MTTATKQHSLQFKVSEAGICTLELEVNRPPVVVLDRDLLEQLNIALDAIQRIENLSGLIIKSRSNSVFVAGADLSEIDSLDDQGLYSYLAFGTTVFTKIANMRCPTVSLINGAALGGGLEMALHCDSLIVANKNSKGKSYPIGLPETTLGLCPGWGGTQLLPAKIDFKEAVESIVSGKPFSSNSMPNGLAEVQVDSPDKLEKKAIDLLSSKKIIKTPQNAPSLKNIKLLEEVKENCSQSETACSVFNAIEAGAKNGFAAGIASEQCELVLLRSTSNARQKLDDFFQRNNSTNG